MKQIVQHILKLQQISLLPKYSGTSIYRFSRDRRKQTMNAGKRSIRETITHYTLRGVFKF